MPATQQRTTIGKEAPIFNSLFLLGLARDRRRRRVLDLQPAVDAAGAVGRAEALRQDTIAAERAGVFVDSRTVATVALIEGDAAGRPAQQLRERGLALLNRRPAHVLPVGLELWGSGIAIEVGGNLLIGLRCAVILGQPAVFIAPADLSRIVVSDVSDTDYLAIVVASRMRGLGATTSDSLPVSMAFPIQSSNVISAVVKGR